MEIISQDSRSILRNEAKRLGFIIDDEKADMLSRFVSELIDANAYFNITAIKNHEDLIYKHILDSFIPAKFIPQSSFVLDIGTGGGFPGIPLKILDPSLHLTLIDSSRKKINFIKFILRQLGLSNITAIQLRAENFTPDTKYDVVISRAVTSLKRFMLLAFPFIKSNGIIIAMKGTEKNVETEISESIKQVNNGSDIIKGLTYNIQIKPYRLKPCDQNRHLVIIKRTD